MLTKLLVFCCFNALFSIVTKCSADTIEIIEIDPRQLQQKIQNQQCQQYANYYDKYYNNHYNNYYNNYYRQSYMKYYDDYYRNFYKQKSTNQQTQIPNISIGNAKVEWVCTNPKTKDTMIIGSETIPSSNNGPFYSEPNRPQPNYPQLQPQPQPNYPQQQPNQQPNYPQPSFTTNPTPQQKPITTPTPQTEKPNTNGEGLIDIRFGDE